MTAELLPDQNHIDQIRKRLWSGREIGQAAVMVGAGFSRNAEKLSPSVPDFPLWNQLAGQIYDHLYSRSGILDPSTREVEIARLGALRLASEYEILFGRQSLDDLLIASIPDKQYLPGKLHKLLLALPWSDVFTTNYDTLLEQTTPFIHDRKYDIVLTPSDIPGRIKPRIIKLHGSFPSHRPFIFTEEDYRIYPKKSAPFVNMVQQSIMENAFCLIGFSGEDPNFLNWIGWVRDNLGESTPSIYLCGILALSNSQRQLLTKRNIIPIDLSPLFPKSKFPDTNVRHARAMEWFIFNLMKGAPPDMTMWPKPPKSPSISIWKPSDDLPDIPSDHSPQFTLGEIHPNLFDGFNSRALQVQELRQLTQNWSKIREQYPGWVVCPIRNRRTLWLYNEYWIEPVLHAIENLTSPEDLLLLYELNWRLETSLMPLFLDWVEIIERVLRKINPFPSLTQIEGAIVRPDTREDINWTDIREKWISLAFAVIREARDDQDEVRFDLWINYLKPVVKQDKQWQARWFYEQCLFHLFRFNQEKVFSLIGEWQTDPNLEFWEIKRASILAELGDLREATRIAEAALAGIRSRIRPYSTDYSLLSQEGWAMLLLEIIQGNEFDRTRAEQNRDRWEKLGLYRCNPKVELETLAAIVDRPPPKPKPDREVREDFEPGRSTVSYNFSSELSFSNMRPAFEFLRVFEEGGIPARCGSVTYYVNEVASATKWILPFAPLWALSSMIRNGNKKEILKQFDRVFVASLSQDSVNHFSSSFLTALTQIIQNLSGNTQQYNLDKNVLLSRFEILSELLSRFGFRLSYSQRTQIFNVVISVCRLTTFPDSFNNTVKILLRRILDTLSQEEILERIHELLLLNIPTELSINQTQEIIDPFLYIEWEENTFLSQDFERSTWSLPIRILIEIVRSGSPLARGHAALRLSKLHEISGLTIEERESFANALWSRVDPDTGLPSETLFYRFAFLKLPEVEEGQAKANFCQYLLSQGFPPILLSSEMPNGIQGWSISSKAIDYIEEWISGNFSLFSVPNKEPEHNFCNWSSDDVKDLLRKIINSWDSQKQEIMRLFRNSLFSSKLEVYFSRLKELVAQIILPKIVEPEDEIKSSIKGFILDLEQTRVSTLSLLPAKLFIEPENYDAVAQKLRFSLNSAKQDEVEGCIQGLYYWFFHSTRGSISSPPDDFLDELINRVIIRRQPGLDSLMRYLSAILKYLPQIFTEKQLESICTALQYLAEETKLPEQLERDMLDDRNILIPVSDRPKYRQLSALIAYQLHQMYAQDSEKIMPEILSVWRDICQNDPLPEVRRAWR